MEQNLLKITYHGAKKISTYIRMPSLTYYVLKKEIEICLFDEHKHPRCEIRTYWIDEDQDEIEIINQNDYEIFLAKRMGREHLQVAPVDATTEKPAATHTAKTTTASASKQSEVPPDSDSNNLAVHKNVSCDACLMEPIVGFRYKCIQCPDYDLCQNCESKHIHSEHMMVRMPNNHCPRVVETYLTGNGSGRKHSKRSKTNCPFVKTGVSVFVNGEEATSNDVGGDENAEKFVPPFAKEHSSRARKHHRRHHRNFLSHIYEMMNDLAEGGGAEAAEHATSQEASSSAKTTTKGPNTNTTTNTNATVFTNCNDAANIAKQAAQHAHEAAVKSSEIASKVAHEAAMQATKNITENLFGPSVSTTSTSNKENHKETTKKNNGATTSPNSSSTEPTIFPPIPPPSLQNLAQFLDPQCVKSGVQILNNFSDMFTRILDPMNGEVGVGPTSKTFNSNSRKSSTTSSKAYVSSNTNEDEKKAEKEQEKDKVYETKQNTNANKQSESDVSSNIEIEDIGSDSESDSVSESFIKLDAPSKEANINTSTTVETTPPQTLNKSNVMDFAQLNANLKAHIAEEAAKYATPVDTNHKNIMTSTTITSTTTASEPVVTTTSATTTSTNTGSNIPEDRRAVPVYHNDQRINNAVHAMMAMGFSNEGAWLTRLLETVDGNIPEALDLMATIKQ